MSRLADKIRQASRTEAAPIGFGAAAARRTSPTLLCLIRLDKDQAKKVPSAADLIIVSGVDADKLGAVRESAGDALLGMELGNGKRKSVAAAREGGADFVVLDEGSSAEAVLERKVGLVLRIGGGLGDTELRALAGLPLDALEIAPIEEPFTLRRLMEVRRLSLLSQTPLLVQVAGDIQPSRLEALREAGVAGVILDGGSAGNLKALQEAIMALPPRGRREERTDALLPSLTGVLAEEGEGPDDE